MEMLTLCSWCPEHVVYKSSVDGQWKPITSTVLAIIQDGGIPLSHGICKSCFKTEMEKIDFEERRDSFLEEESGEEDQGLQVRLVPEVSPLTKTGDLVPEGKTRRT